MDQQSSKNQKLSLKKETVSKLNDEQMQNVKGGKNFLSIGDDCTTIKNDDCVCDNALTDGLFCREHYK